MTAHLPADIEAALVSLRRFLATCPPWLHGARIVHYAGSDLMGTHDVTLDTVESRVAGSMGEGLRVDWVCRNELLYLRVFAAGAAAPSWERVFAEQDLADMRSALGNDDAA